MARIVAGFASSHTPLMSEPGTKWQDRVDVVDKKNRDLIRPSDGKHVTYEELLGSADPAIVAELDVEKMCAKFDAVQAALQELEDSFTRVDPDVVVMIGDDQDELLFDDNYPMISVYWGDVLTHYPRTLTHRRMITGSEVPRWLAVYGSEIIDYPVQTDLGLHLINHLVDEDFDVAQSRYTAEVHGGSIGPGGWYLDYERKTKPRLQGMAHAYAFPINRWFAGKRPPMVPITINTCYPPNWISPRRAYALGGAIRRGIEAWDSDVRVAIVTSGGFSHFVVDEEIDRLAIEGLVSADEKILTTLPRYKLQSATTEILNWVTAAGAMGGTPLDLLTYQPGYRTPAGTGCGLAVGRWIP
jgi:3-O-methylgallate 3,4-dioxygenase